MLTYNSIVIEKCTRLKLKNNIKPFFFNTNKVYVFTLLFPKSKVVNEVKINIVSEKCFRLLARCEEGTLYIKITKH